MGEIGIVAHGVACMHSCMPGKTGYACHSDFILGISDWVNARTHSTPGLSTWMLALL